MYLTSSKSREICNDILVIYLETLVIVTSKKQSLVTFLSRQNSTAIAQLLAKNLRGHYVIGNERNYIAGNYTPRQVLERLS